MSTVPSDATSTTDEPLANVLLDYPGADIILLSLRSQDSHHLRVPKIFIINNSPVLNELIRRTLDTPGDPNAEVSPPVVQLPESGKILHYLLTFILPVVPTIPPTHEETMELLFVAQKYEIETVLSSHSSNHRSTEPTAHPSRASTPHLCPRTEVRTSTGGASIRAYHIETLDNYWGSRGQARYYARRFPL